MSIAALDQILERVHARPTRGGWMGHCPTELHGHGDRHSSLSIGEGNGGRILLHCFSGCPPERIVAAVGLSMSDLFSESRNPQHKPEPPEVHAARQRAADAMADLRSRLTARERVLPITIIETDSAGADAAISRALALTIEEELVQVVLVEECA